MGNQDKPITEVLKGGFSNLKWWQATIMMTSILVASGFAAYMGVNVTANVTMDLRLQRLEDQVNIPVNSTISAFMKEASYIISVHDVGGTVYYCLMNGTDDRAGRLEFYNTNKTLVEQYALGNLTGGSGTVYLKGVQHNYSVTVPANVSVIESVNGVARRFINIANSHGSPYTVSVDNVVSGYYLGQDSLLNYINSWSSTNATLVWQYAIDNTTAGGKIVVRAGSYALDQVTPKSSITICGEGNSTLLWQRSGSDKDLFRTTTMIESFVISDFRLSGNTAGNSIGNLFNLTIPRRCVFERLTIDDANGYIFFLTGTTGSYGYFNTIRDCHTISADIGFLFVRWCDENTIDNNVIGGCGQYGLNLWAGLNHVYGNSFVAGSLGQLDLYMGYEAGNVVECNTFDTATTPVAIKRHAIKIEYSALEGAVIIGNDFNNQGNSTQSTIYVTGSANVIVSHNTFRGTSLPEYVVEIDSAKNFSMKDNTFDCGYTTGIFGLTGTTTGLDVEGNIGFITENYVSGANTTGTTIVISHGCAWTPDYVFASFNFTGWTSWSWTATSTVITITMTGTLPASYTAYAYVKYEP